MPKLTDILLAIEKNPMKKFNNYRSLYPYKQILPAALRNWVSGQGENKKSLVCLQEMSLMLACLKKQEFDQSSCAKEIESFSLCCDQQMSKGQIDSRGRPPSELVNSVLRKYPQPKPRKY